MKHVDQIKRSYPKVDRDGTYLQACRELAEETGADMEAVWDEFCERAGVRQYLGVIDRPEAEALALEDVRERFRRAS